MPILCVLSSIHKAMEQEASSRSKEQAKSLVVDFKLAQQTTAGKATAL